MDKVIKNKRDLELELIPLQVTKQVQKNFLISYILSDKVHLKIYYKAALELLQKLYLEIYATQCYHKLFHFYLSF